MKNKGLGKNTMKARTVKRVHRRLFWPFHVDVCNHSLSLGPDSSYTQSHFPLCITIQMAKRSEDNLLLLITRDTNNGDREKSSGKTHLFNICI